MTDPAPIIEFLPTVTGAPKELLDPIKDPFLINVLLFLTPS